MTEQLKPCPFCGGEASFKPRSFKASCDKCGAHVPVGATDSAEAIAAWNTRAAPKVKPLVWDERYDGVSRAEYRPRHFYECHDIGRGWVCHETIHGTGHSIGEVWTTREEAKAAAQADYERRILEALE